MANNSQAVSILKPNPNGVIWYAPKGTQLPTSFNDLQTVIETWKTAGYISSDGLETSDNYEAGEGKKAYGGDTVVNATPSMNPSLKFTIWETSNPVALGLAYNDDDISGTVNNVTLKKTNKTPDDCAIVLLFVRSNEVMQMEVYPHAVFGGRDDNTRDDENPDAVTVTWNFRNVDGLYGYVYQGVKTDG